MLTLSLLPLPLPLPPLLPPLLLLLPQPGLHRAPTVRSGCRQPAIMLPRLPERRRQSDHGSGCAVTTLCVRVFVYACVRACSCVHVCVRACGQMHLASPMFRLRVLRVLRMAASPALEVLRDHCLSRGCGLVLFKRGCSCSCVCGHAAAGMRCDEHRPGPCLPRRRGERAVFRSWWLPYENGSIASYCVGGLCVRSDRGEGQETLRRPARAVRLCVLPVRRAGYVFETSYSMYSIVEVSYKAVPTSSVRT